MQLPPTPTLTDYEKQNTPQKRHFNNLESKVHTSGVSCILTTENSEKKNNEKCHFFVTAVFSGLTI